MEVTAEAFVEGSEDIVEGDLMTIKVTINRLHLEEDEEQGYVHAPYFPFNKYENVWIIIGNIQLNQVYHIKKLTDQGKVIVDDSFKIPIGGYPILIRPGNYTWDVTVKSDSYYDID
mmetsp:Transcript_29085/g.5263  ORF Transcript_29085/g.5263 Transcript_29085/m.5263 type:complete len:116 (-) Transcript_29085:220-567(-)